MNGKSTLVDVLSALLSEYAAKSPISTFLVSRNDKIPNDPAVLQGVRFVYASEVEEGRRLSESLIKDLTGGEKIRAPFLPQGVVRVPATKPCRFIRDTGS